MLFLNHRFQEAVCPMAGRGSDQESISGIIFF
jgi:hypothetical protein